MSTTLKWLRSRLGWVALSLLFAGSVARADAASDARAHYERALKFYDDGVFDAALVELTRAYELNPSYRIVYNIAQARVAMRDYAGAVESFQRYLREGAGQVPNDRVAAVRAQLSELQQRVGSLTIETDVAGSEVLIDDAVVGSAPLDSPVIVNAGVRRVTVRHADYPARSERLSIAGGEQLRTTLLLKPRQPEAAPVPVALVAPEAPPLRLQPSAADETQTDHTAAWLMTGVTGALAATAIVCAVVAQTQDSALDERRSRPGEDVTKFDEDRDALQRTALFADVFTIAAVASAGVTTWLWLSGGDDKSDRAAVRVGLAGVGLQLRGEL
jgi:PEGA domain